MRKTVCYCDICRRETPDADLQLFNVEDKNIYEICKGCRTTILRRVIRDRLLTLTPWCKICQGMGVIKESVGCDYDHNEYETKKCENCKL